jgi:polysaccharide biosynthesis protein PslG
MRKIILTGAFFLFCYMSMTASMLPDGETGKSDHPGKFGPLNQVCAGINIHFITGQKKDLDMIAAAGFKFIRMDFDWQEIERKKGTYDWKAYDELTANLEKRGMGAIYIFDYSNSLYEETTDSKDPLTGMEQKDIASPHHPESIAAFARWAAEAARHFKDKNIIWEIWNEPNIFFWKPTPDVAQYNSLAMATCKAVKEVVPDATIIGPASSEVPLPFLESFLASGVLKYLDAVSIHPYRDYANSPETAVSDYRKLRELIERYAPAEKKKMPIISSEWGYSSSTKGVSLEKQEAYIVRMQLSNLFNGIPISIWYDWKNDGDDPTEHEQNFGTVSSDLKPKPAYTAIQTMNIQLKGFTFSRRIHIKNDNDFVLLFRNDEGNFKIVAWTMDPAHSVKIDENIPKVTGSTEIDGEGKVLKLKTEQGRLVLDLNALPQYITLPSGIGMN